MKEANEIASSLRDSALSWYLDDREKVREATVDMYANDVMVDLVYGLGYHDDPEDIAVHEFLRNLADLIERPVASNIAADSSAFHCNNCCAKFDKGMAHFEYCPHCGAKVR